MAHTCTACTEDSKANFHPGESSMHNFSVAATGTVLYSLRFSDMHERYCGHADLSSYNQSDTSAWFPPLKKPQSYNCTWNRHFLSALRVSQCVPLIYNNKNGDIPCRKAYRQQIAHHGGHRSSSCRLIKGYRQLIVFMILQQLHQLVTKTDQ